MQYLKAEYLKFKSSATNKLIWIAPIIVCIIGSLMGGNKDPECYILYWWYIFLLPGTLTILTNLAISKEINSGKYYSVFSMPIDLKKFEISKLLIILEKALACSAILGILLLLPVSLFNLFTLPAYHYQVSYSFIYCVFCSIFVTIAYIWIIPLSMILIRKIGMAVTLILNTVLGFFSIPVFSNIKFGWLFPYCWAGKAAEPLMGIKFNGELGGDVHFSLTSIIIFIISILLFVFLAYVDENIFSKREVK